jgi:hypothetical protein
MKRIVSFPLLLGILLLGSCSSTPIKKEVGSEKPQQNVGVSSARQEDPVRQRASINDYLENTREVIDSTVSQILSNVPKRESSATGFVVSVREQAIYVDLVAKDGIQVGAELSVYREEEELKHPVTGQVLGVPKQALGVLQVTQVEQGYSVVRVLSIEEGKTIQPKDRVVLRSGASTVAVLPFFSNSVTLASVNLEPLRMSISEQLQSPGTLEVIKSAEIDRVLKEKGFKLNQVLDQRGIKEAAVQLKASYLVDGIVQQEGGKWVLRSRLLSSTDGTTLSEVSTRLALSESLGTDAQVVAKGQEVTGPSVDKAEIPKQAGGESTSVVTPLPATSQVQKTPEIKPEAKSDGPGPSKQVSSKKGEFVEVGRSQPFPFGIHGLDVGDLYGDGRKELVIIGHTSVQIYSLPKAFDGNPVELEEIYIDRGPRKAFYMSVSVGDINKNGRDEIFVTNLLAERLSSFVLEYKEGKFVPIAQDQNVFFRVLKGKNRPPELIAQRYGATQIFFGDLLRYEWKNNRYQTVGTLSLPGKIDIYGFALLNADNGKGPDVLSLDDEDHLKLLRGGKVTWKSREFYGGSKLSLLKTRDQETADLVLEANESREALQGVSRITIKEKILTEDLDQDGVLEVILRKNINPVRIVKGIVSYQKGQMAVLEWNGISLQEQYATPVLDNYISDYQLAPGGVDGSDLLVVGLNQDEGFFTPTQQSLIMFFKVNIY